MWDFPGSGIEPMSPTLAGGFLCTAPRGKFTGAVLEGEHNGLLETVQLSRLSIAVYGLPRSGVKGNSWRNWSWPQWKMPYGGQDLKDLRSGAWKESEAESKRKRARAKARGLKPKLGEVYGSLRIPGFWHQIRSQGGFPGGSDDKESVCNAGDLDLIPGSGRSPGEGKGNPIPVFLPRKSRGQRSLVGCSPWGCKRVRHYWGTKHFTSSSPGHLACSGLKMDFSSRPETEVRPGQWEHWILATSPPGTRGQWQGPGPSAVQKWIST